ncbi:MAG TPA: prolyl oligopeptidase family serine peptidase, partial [Pseudonocardiaceae bacterium]
MSLPEWARDAQDRNIYMSNASGVWEIYAWDRATDTHRRVTDRPHGTLNATISPDGTGIWWFDDTAGDEFGVWVREPFGGKQDGEPVRPAVVGPPDSYPAGLAVGRDVVAVGSDTDDGSTVWLAHGGGAAEVVYSSEHSAGVGGLSRDESLLAVTHSEHGDSRHMALRVLATATGHAVANKWDGAGKGLEPLGFAPVAGDTRLLVAHERRGRDELLIWDIGSDTETVLELDLPGDITGDWYPDGTALLVVHTHQARNTLHRLDLATNELSTVDSAPGIIGMAGVRADGTVEYSWSNAASPHQIRAVGTDGVDRVLLTPPGPRAPAATNVTDVFVDGPGGQVHALVARPAADGPLPTVFLVHGGPHAADDDRFSAYRAVWVDAGFAVIEVNYRGSTGYGSAWRDAIEGRPGLTELEDVAAVYDWAVGSGLSDPARMVVEGGSWGGYLTLMALGTQPERWAAGVAIVPVADYVTAYADEMEPLRDFDRALFGGSPDELPDRYRECSPITYVDQVRAPVL